MADATTVPRASRARSWWGWGWADDHADDAECTAMGALLPGTLSRPLPVPRVADLRIGRPAVDPPRSLAHLVTADPEARAAHAMGKAYRDVIRALRGRPGRVPDLVARPECDQDVADLLEWAGGHAVAVIPYGGGSSVTGGVEYRGDAHRAVLSLDLTMMDRVLEIDTESRAARIQAGALGPALEDQLRSHALTLRHFPQSFEFSTLGGWLATRAGGHYATVHTHIDDFVQSLRVVAPAGAGTSWRLPASGAGPSPDRLFLGSEGAWASSPRRGCASRNAPVTRRRPRCPSPTSPPRCARCARSPSRASRRPTAACWTPARLLCPALPGTVRPCSSSASSPPPCPSTPTSPRRWIWPAPTAA